MNRFDRRSALRLLGAGTLALPLIPGAARAALRPGAPASRLLILNLTGGIRSSAAFLASPEERYNPWGLIEGSTMPFPIGQLLDDHLLASSANARAEAPLPDEAYRLEAAGPWSGVQLPRFRESVAASRFSVAGTWHPERGDHLRARIEEVTGSAASDEPGLLVRIFGALAAAAPELTAVPPVHLRPAALFGLATGDDARYLPVALSGPEALPTPRASDDAVSRATGRGFTGGEAALGRLDLGAISRRAGFGRALAEVFASHRAAARTAGARLGDPALRVADPEASAEASGRVRTAAGTVPLTNAMLHELFVRALGPEADDPTRSRPLADPTAAEHYEGAIDVATGVRLLQAGSPAVVVELGGFDFHSEERAGAPGLYRFLGRTLATLEWLLGRIEDPTVQGATMLDRTLVLTTSDFGRDPGPVRGFNGGEGSDHGTDPSCYYLAHLLFGGGVRGGRLVAGVDTRTYDARRASVRHDPRTLLATTLWALGLPFADDRWGFPDVASPIEGLW